MICSVSVAVKPVGKHEGEQVDKKWGKVEPYGLVKDVKDSIDDPAHAHPKAILAERDPYLLLVVVHLV